MQWMVDKHLAAADRLQIRAFVAVANGIGAEGRQVVAPKVGSENLDEARVALSIVTDGNFKEAAPYLPIALKRQELQRAAARAAGALGSRESIPDLLALTLNPDRLTALNAVTSLVALADPSTVGTAQALLGSPELPMRKGAIQLIGKFPEQALRIGKMLLGDSDQKLARSGVEILGNLGTPEALDAIGRLLETGGSGLKIQAMLALNGRVPEAYRTSVLEARKDIDPLVRAVAMRTDLGR
jgi:HEAT repeat protein